MEDLTPEELQTLMGLSVNGQQQGLADKQLGFANALRAYRPEAASTGAGGALGALGGALTNLAGGLKARAATTQLQKLQADRQAGLTDFAKAYFKRKGNDAAGSQYAVAPAPDYQLQSAFSFDQ